MAFRSIGVRILTKLRLREHGDFNPLHRPILTECSYLLYKVKALGLGEVLRNQRERIHIGALKNPVSQSFCPEMSQLMLVPLLT